MKEFVAYFDDSGHPDQDLVLAAGFVSTKDQWLRLDQEWKQALVDCGLPADCTFHMTDMMAASGKSPFRVWTRHQKHRLLDKLVHLLAVRTVRHFSETLFMADYRSVNDEYALEECIGAPFAIVGRNVLYKLHQWLATQGSEARLRVFFEDGMKHKGDLIDCCMRDKIPIPQFGKKEDLVALQTADLLAWEIAMNTRQIVTKSKGELWYKDYFFDVLARYNRYQGDDGNFRLEHLKELCDGSGGHPSVRLRTNIKPGEYFVHHSLPKKPRRRTVF